MLKRPSHELAVARAGLARAQLDQRLGRGAPDDVQKARLREMKARADVAAERVRGFTR